jgi:ABC-type maltose transport system permease subunit
MTTTPTTTNADTGNRIDQFKSEVTDLNLKTGNAGREKGLVILGVLMMIAAVVVSFFAYAASRNYDDARDIQTMLILAVTMAALAVFGAALFLRYSLAGFLRMWLLRNLYEGQANTDRIVEAVTDRR